MAPTMMRVIIKVSLRPANPTVPPSPNMPPHSPHLTHHPLVIIKVFVDNSLLKVVVTAPVVLFGLITNLLYKAFKARCHES